MTKDEIIALAREAVEISGYAFDPELDAPDWLEAFAHLCRADLVADIAGYYLPLTNETMQNRIDVLIAHAKRARWTNAVVRKDGVETTYEADWIKWLVPHPTKETK